MKRILIISTLAIAVTVLSFAPADAQEEGRDSGFYLGLKLLGSSLHVDDEDQGAFFVKDDGGGAQLNAGYSFNQVFSLELAFTGVKHETSDPTIDARLGGVQLFAHYRFAPGRAFRPYIKGGLAGYALELDDSNIDVRVEGGGIPLGGGFDYFFSRHFSLGVDFTHNIINYEEIIVDFPDASVSVDIDEEGSMSSLGLAFAYYF